MEGLLKQAEALTSELETAADNSVSMFSNWRLMQAVVSSLKHGGGVHLAPVIYDEDLEGLSDNDLKNALYGLEETLQDYLSGELLLLAEEKKYVWTGKWDVYREADEGAERAINATNVVALGGRIE